MEDIQDSVENVLIQAGYSMWPKAYILYRKQREKIRNMKSTILDYKEIVNSYVKVEDWRVKRELYGYLFCRRSDLQQFRSGHCQLLAV